ncbi:hypothetical protein L9F63_008701 [Diploptera punctata]|uniref:Dynein regulatory complex subunit 2 n=1 Tax=Diploptera punctata TaxID=6984 RepID=A0AAD7Z596_DIPPU|nr:hypothetical protein L9F63_008701 [Diploptera punctata]
MDMLFDLEEPPPEEPPKKKKPTRAEKRAAKRLKLEEEKKQHQRDHLQRELRQSEMNWKILKQKFINTIVKMKLPEMRDDAVTVWHSFDRTIDLKNCIISRLLDFLDETDEQYRINQQSHVEMIDGLISFYNGQLDKLRGNYTERLSLTKNEDKEINNSLETRNGIQTGQLEAIMFAMEKTFQNYMTNFKSDSIAKIEDDVNKYQELTQNLREELEKQIEIHWNQLKGVLEEYVTSTSKMKEQFRTLRYTDMCLMEEVHMQTLRTQNLQESIKMLKEKLAEVKEKKVEAISNLISEKQYYLDRLQKLKIQLKDEINNDEIQIKTLVQESNASIKWLQHLSGKGERILRITAVCRKFETEKEKIVPYPLLPISATLEVQEAGNGSCESLIQVHENYQSMEYFWQRVGNVDRKRKEMSQYYDTVLLENRYLYRSLKQYLKLLNPNSHPCNSNKIISGYIGTKI